MATVTMNTIAPIDFNAYKNTTAVKNAVRENAFSTLLSALTAIYGEDAVSVVGSNEIAVAVGTITDKDGYNAEVCFTVKPTAKDYEDRKTTQKVFEKFDRITEADIYAKSVNEKKAEKEENAKKKAAKLAEEKAEKARKLQEKADKAKAEIWA